MAQPPSLLAEKCFRDKISGLEGAVPFLLFDPAGLQQGKAAAKVAFHSHRALRSFASKETARALKGLPVNYDCFNTSEEHIQRGT